MEAVGVVRAWHDEGGAVVVDPDVTPGWVHPGLSAAHPSTPSHGEPDA